MNDLNPDPRPEAPRRPEPQECCDSGCDPCILDLYNEEMTIYRAQLAEWEKRQVATQGREQA